MSDNEENDVKGWKNCASEMLVASDKLVDGEDSLTGKRRCCNICQRVAHPTWMVRKH